MRLCLRGEDCQQGGAVTIFGPLTQELVGVPNCTALKSRATSIRLIGCETVPRSETAYR
jgi:hypothetical protein